MNIFNKFTKQKTKEVTFKSTQNTNSNPDHSEPTSERKNPIEYSKKVEKLSLQTQYKFTRYIHKNFTMQFDDLKDYSKHYDIYSKFSSHIIE